VSAKSFVMRLKNCKPNSPGCKTKELDKMKKPLVLLALAGVMCVPALAYAERQEPSQPG
jgi:hypothetical protein